MYVYMYTYTTYGNYLSCFNKTRSCVQHMEIPPSALAEQILHGVKSL